MADTVTRMGFEGRILRGTGGSVAGTDMTDSATDVTISISHERAKTTVRGAGTSPPMTTERVVAVTVGIEFTLLNVQGKAHVDALRTAANAGTPVSIRTKDYSSGKGFDGDVTIEYKEGQPLNGEQTYQFTATPTNEKGREPKGCI